MIVTSRMTFGRRAIALPMKTPPSALKRETCTRTGMLSMMLQRGQSLDDARFLATNEST